MQKIIDKIVEFRCGYLFLALKNLLTLWIILLVFGRANTSFEKIVFALLIGGYLALETKLSFLAMFIAMNKGMEAELKKDFRSHIRFFVGITCNLIFSLICLFQIVRVVL